MWLYGDRTLSRTRSSSAFADLGAIKADANPVQKHRRRTADKGERRTRERLPEPRVGRLPCAEAMLLARREGSAIVQRRFAQRGRSQPALGPYRRAGRRRRSWNFTSSVVRYPRPPWPALAI